MIFDPEFQSRYCALKARQAAEVERLIFFRGDRVMAIMTELEFGRRTKKPVRSDDKLLLSRQEAAARLSISQRSLDYLVATKALSVRRIGSRVLVALQDLQRFAGADHPGKLAG